jgi:GNAT superfamily N-acetyltransferase
MKYARPKIALDIYQIFDSDKEMMWNLFKKHHYLSETINKAAHCYIAKWGNKIVGFEAVLPLPSGTLKNAWREHRLVVLSDFQGLGIGISLSETIGEILKHRGKRFYSKTANIKLGEYRNKSPLWRNTPQNGKNRMAEITRQAKLADVPMEERTSKMTYDPFLLKRVCYSHEYIGRKE